jgi:solute carrier family 25 (mitochondrial phosphate transporter), member 23/24/25/41
LQAGIENGHYNVDKHAYAALRYAAMEDVSSDNSAEILRDSDALSSFEDSLFGTRYSSIRYDTFVKAVTDERKCPTVLYRYIQQQQQLIQHLRSITTTVTTAGTASSSSNDQMKPNALAALKHPVHTINGRLHNDKGAAVVAESAAVNSKQDDVVVLEQVSMGLLTSSSTTAANTAVVPLLIASIAGAVGRCLVAPLERIKILRQTQAVNTGFDSLVPSLRTMVNDAKQHTTTASSQKHSRNTIRELWRGNGLNIARIVPVLALQTVAYHYLQSSISNSNDSSNSSSSSSSNGALSLEAKHLIAGGLAGATANVLTTPLEVIRARYTVDRSGASLRQIVTTLLSSDGSRGLLRGIVPTTLWAFCYIGTSYTIMAVMKPLYNSDRALSSAQRSALQQQQQHNSNFRNSSNSSSRSNNSSTSSNGGGSSSTNSVNHKPALYCGLVAGLCGQAVAFPFDTIRRRLQVMPRTLTVTNNSATSSTSLAATFMQSQSYRGLYRGFTVMSVKFIPSFSCSYVVTSALLSATQAQQ